MNPHNPTPFQIGFMFKIWDQLAGSEWKGDDLSAYTSVSKGGRTLKEFENIHKPDYSVLLSPAWWANPGTAVTKKVGN